MPRHPRLEHPARPRIQTSTNVPLIIRGQPNQRPLVHQKLAALRAHRRRPRPAVAQKNTVAPLPKRMMRVTKNHRSRPMHARNAMHHVRHVLPRLGQPRLRSDSVIQRKHHPRQQQPRQTPRQTLHGAEHHARHHAAQDHEHPIEPQVPRNRVHVIRGKLQQTRMPRRRQKTRATLAHARNDVVSSLQTTRPLSRSANLRHDARHAKHPHPHDRPTREEVIPNPVPRVPRLRQVERTVNMRVEVAKTSNENAGTDRSDRRHDFSTIIQVRRHRISKRAIRVVQVPMLDQNPVRSQVKPRAKMDACHDAAA